MSGTREISEQKANALNFFILSSQPIRGFDFGLSTNGKPLFQVLRFWLTSKIRLQSQQSDCNLSNQTAISAIRLQSQQSECNLSNQTAISAIRLQSSCIAVWLCRLQFDCGDCSLIVKIAVKLWRLQSFYADCCLIVEIAVWLWRLPSGMSGMKEISERKANALNFLNPVLSTNQRPRFWALNQWEASISGPPILTHFQNQTANSAIKYHLSNHTAISAIRTQSPQSECNLSNQTAILLHCSLIVEIAVG